MEVKALVVGPSLFCAHQLFWRSLGVRQDHLKLRPMQVQISAPNQQQHDQYRTASYPLHTTPLESSVLSFISAYPRNSALQNLLDDCPLLAWGGQPANSSDHAEDNRSL